MCNVGTPSAPSPSAWQDPRIVDDRPLTELVPNLDEEIRRLDLTRVVASGFDLHDESVPSPPASDSAARGTTPAEATATDKVVENLLRYEDYYRANGSFIKLLFAQAASQSWVPDDETGILDKLMAELCVTELPMSGVELTSVKVLRAPSGTSPATYTWHLRDSNSEWIQVLPPGKLSEKTWVQAWCKMANCIIQMAADLAGATGRDPTTLPPDQPSTYAQEKPPQRPLFWESAARGVRFHAWGEEPLRLRPEAHGKGPIPRIGVPRPGLLIGLKEVIERIEAESQAFVDDCFTGEVRVGNEGDVITDARRSVLFTLTSLKDNTLATGNAWSLM